jgi:RsiW-degrading membrane proteinase PrsW (M82 family)
MPWKVYTMNGPLEQNNTLGRWLWLKILLSGFIMFYLVDYALKVTENIHYVPTLLVVGTFTIPLSFLIMLYTRRQTPQVSVADLLTCVLWGGIFGTVVAGIIEYDTLRQLKLLPTFVVGLTEEVAKLMVPALFILIGRHWSELDSITIGAASGAGFAIFESMGYGLVVLLVSGGNIAAFTEVMLLRGILTSAAHIAWTAIAANALWILVHGKHEHRLWRFMYMFSGVVLLHALWDSSVRIGIIAVIVLCLVSLSWLLLRLRQAVRKELGYA